MARGVGRPAVIAAAAVVLVAAVGGAYAAGLLGVPTVAGVENRFAGVNQTTTLIETDLTVHNPNPVGASLGGLGIDYTVRLNDVELATGSKRGIDIGAGNSTLTFTTAMANDRIPPWWVSHIRNGEHTVMRVDATVTSGLLGRSIEVTPVERPVDTDILSAFNSTETRPVDADAPLVSDPVLYVNETSAVWGDVSTARTPMEMTFVVYNPKSAPYVITEIRYDITMNDVPVGDGATTREYVIQPRSERTVTATTAIRNEALDAWWVTHLRNDQVTALRIEFAATIELPTGETVDVPLDAMTYTETIETDFFGTKAEPSSGQPSTDDGAGTPTATPAGDDGEGTPTATPTGADGTPADDGTSTPTPTPDDGGLPIGALPAPGRP